MARDIPSDMLLHLIQHGYSDDEISAATQQFMLVGFWRSKHGCEWGEEGKKASGTNVLPAQLFTEPTADSGAIEGG